MLDNEKISTPQQVIWEYRVALAQLRNEVPLVTTGRPKFTPKLPSLPFDDDHPNLIHPSLDRAHSPPQTASGSSQPFCHNTLFGPTDGIGDNSIPRALTLHYIDRERRANNVKMERTVSIQCEIYSLQFVYICSLSGCWRKL